MSGDRHADQVRVCVGVDDRHHRDAELVRLRDGDALLLRVHDEQRARQAAHVLDAGEVLLELQTLAVEQQLLFLGVVLELTFADPLLQILQPLDLLLDRLEVRERTTQPALGHVERAARLRLRLENVLELLLGADEQDALTLQHHAAQQLLRGLDLTKGLLQVDDVDAGAFGEDEAPHLRIPATRLVAEVHARFQQILQLDRKSTRLNSSHSQISYAVFCLKKKKRMITSMSVAYMQSVPAIMHDQAPACSASASQI